MYGTFSVWVDPVKPLRLTMLYSYVSDQYQGNDEENVGPKLDAYGLLGLRMNAILGDYVSLELSVDNVLDKTYASAAYSGAYYPGNGRAFRAGLTVEF